SAHMMATSLEGEDLDQGRRVRVTYRTGRASIGAVFATDVPRAGVHYPLPPGQQTRAISERLADGSPMVFPAALDRDTSWSQQGSSGRLEKNGAVLETQPGRKAYLIVEPSRKGVLAYNPLADPTAWRLTRRRRRAGGAASRSARWRCARDRDRPRPPRRPASHRSRAEDLARGFRRRPLRTDQRPPDRRRLASGPGHGPMGRCGAAGARAGHPAALIFAFRALSFERSLRLIFLNRFFHPDHSATSQMLSDLAFALAEQGNAVCVITSRQRYDAPADTLPPKEVLDGVCVHRVWSTRFGRVALVGRAIDYLTFYLSAAWCLWRLARTGDTVVAKTDPPMLSVTALPVCRLRGARLVNWLQDIFPETAEALGVGGPVARVPYRLMRWLRNGSLRAADMNVVLGERMANRVAALGVRSECIRIIPNWADGGAVAPVEPPANR